MAGVADQLQTFQFEDIKFAVSRYSVKGGLRDHVHEYRHTPGGQGEKLGRRLYTVECDAIFSTETPSFPNAWPDDLSALRFLFESEVTRALIIPTLGTMQAYCIDWPTDVDFQRMRDGERAHFTFREDQQIAIAFEDVVRITYATIDRNAKALIAELDDAGLSTDLFDSVLDAAQAVSSLKDQVELQGELLADKVDKLSAACAIADDTIDALNDPPHYQVLNALQNLWGSATKLNEDVLRTLNPVNVFVTTVEMTVTDVATAIYGDTQRAMELLMLNPIEDAFAIPAKSSLKFYVPKT